MSAAEDVIPLVQERLVLGKRRISTGRVRVETVTETVTDVARADLTTEDVEVTRIAVGRVVTAVPPVRTEGDVTIIPVVEEVLVVEKRLVLKEEIRLTRRRNLRHDEQPVTLRRQRAIVTRDGPAQSPFTENDTMNDHANHNLTAFFDSREDAERAISQLRDLGLTEANIRLTGGEDYADRPVGDYQERGFWDSIANFFFPPEDRVTYAEGLRRGGYLLAVSGVPDGVYDRALDILEDEGSIDLDERSSEWRSEGWSAEAVPISTAAAGGAAAVAGMDLLSSRRDEDDGYARERLAAVDEDLDRSALPDEAMLEEDVVAYSDTGDRIRDDGDEVIPVVREQLRVGKRDVNLGRIRVRSYIVEEPVSESVTLRQDHVEIERRPVDRVLTGDEAAFQDRVIEAEEHSEEAVISKEARVTEEIALRRTSEERTETVTETLRHTEVEVEDERATGTTRTPERHDI